MGIACKSAKFNQGYLMMMLREKEMLDMPAPPAEPLPIRSDDEQKAELRRLMYERIARGNALAEAEENAQRKQRGA